MRRRRRGCWRSLRRRDAWARPPSDSSKSTSNLFRDRAPRTRPRIDLGHFNEVVRVDAQARPCRSRGHDDVRRSCRRHARRRRDAGRRAPVEVDHAWRRGSRRRHRGNVVSARPRARYDRRHGHPDRRWPHHRVHGGQRAPGPVPWISELVRYARVRAEAHGANCASEAQRAGRARALPRRRSIFRRRSRGAAPTRRSISSTGSRSLATTSCCRARASSTMRRASATTRTSASIIVRCARSRSITSRRAITCGAGTPTGSGARGTSARSTRACGGCSAEAAELGHVPEDHALEHALARHRAFDRMRGVHSESVIQDVDIPIARARGIPRLPARRSRHRCPSGSVRSAAPDPDAEATLYPLPPRHAVRSISDSGTPSRRARRVPSASSIARSSARCARSAASSRCIRTRISPKTSSGRSTTGRRTPRSRPDTIHAAHWATCTPSACCGNERLTRYSARPFLPVCHRAVRQALRSPDRAGTTRCAFERAPAAPGQ